MDNLVETFGPTVWKQWKNTSVQSSSAAAGLWCWPCGSEHSHHGYSSTTSFKKDILN